MTRVILASASPRRRELLAALVPVFDVLPAAIAEQLTADPIADCERLARDKARHVAAQAPPGSIVIGADTIVFRDGRSYGKPDSPGEAAATLRTLRGAPHFVVTGLAVVRGDDAEVGYSRAHVTLAPLSDEAIAAYVASGRPLDKAGGYAIQDDDVPTVAALDGCYCCVVGLPLWRLRSMLATAGVATPPPDQALARCAACPERPAER
ncbi:MAG: Maf family protein [Chloroflexota bacterium]